MAAPQSRRAKILKNLQAQLETITVEHGYTRDVYKVTMDVKGWRDTPEAETPTLYIVDDSTHYQYHAGRTTERTWTVSIFGVMRNCTQLELEEFISDVEVCLQANVTLYMAESGKVIDHHRITGIVTDNQLFSEIDGTQLFKVTLDLIYTACVDNPR